MNFLDIQLTEVFFIEKIESLVNQKAIKDNK